MSASTLVAAGSTSPNLPSLPAQNVSFSPAHVTSLGAPKTRIIDGTFVRLPRYDGDAGSPAGEYYPQLCYPNVIRLWTASDGDRKHWIQPNAVRVQGDKVDVEGLRRMLSPLGLKATIGVKQRYKDESAEQKGEVLEFASSLEATQALEYGLNPEEWLRRSGQIQWRFAREEIRSLDNCKRPDVLMMLKGVPSSPILASKETSDLPSLASSDLPRSPASALPTLTPTVRLRQPSTDPDLLYSSTSILLSSIKGLMSTLSPKSLGLGVPLAPLPPVIPLSGPGGMPFLQPKTQLAANTPQTTLEMLKPHQWRFDPHYSRRKGCPPAAKRFRDVLQLQDPPIYRPGERKIDIKPPPLSEKEQAAQVFHESPSKHVSLHKLPAKPPGLPVPASGYSHEPDLWHPPHPSAMPTSAPWKSSQAPSLATQVVQMSSVAQALAVAGAQTKQSVATRVNNAVQSMWPQRVQS